MENNKIINADSNSSTVSVLAQYEAELAKNNFFIKRGKLLYQQSSKMEREVANFVPIITQKNIITNGADKIIKYKLKAVVIENGQELDEIEVSAEQLKNFRFIIGSNWDQYAIITSNNFNYLRQVAQIISKFTMKTKMTYSNTGFVRQKNGSLIYLYHEGCIGNSSEEINADLSLEGLSQYCFTNKQFNLTEALKATNFISEIADKSVTIPMLAYCFITPLTSLLHEQNIFNDFVLIFIGGTGRGKSSMASIANSFFGNFNRNNFNTSLYDTPNKIEKQSFILKDSLMVPDDLNPEKFISKEMLVSKILGLFGDRQARGRLKPDGTIKTTYYSRGTAILTGEYLPELSESRLARAFILQFDKNTVNIEKLNLALQNKDVYAYTMKKYIGWIIDNEANIMQASKNIIQQMQNSQELKSCNFHGRTKEAIIILYLGYYLYLQFLMSNQIKTLEEVQNELNQAFQILINNANKQYTEQKEQDTVNQFYNAIEEMLQIGEINLMDYKTGKLINNSKDVVGYIDDDRLYLLYNSVFNRVYRFYLASGSKFLSTKPAFLKKLQEEGLLLTYENDKSRKEMFKTDPITKQKVKVINIYKNFKIAEEEEQE